jgi:hypothetical protein
MNPAAFGGPAIGPVPIEFILFALVLIGVALFHRHTLRIALAGAAVIALHKIVFSPFKTGAGLRLRWALLHEWVILVNLLLLLWAFPCWPNTSRTPRSRRCCRATCPTTGKAASCCCCWCSCCRAFSTTSPPR